MILRAPAQHGQTLAVPPLDQVSSLLQSNLGTFAATVFGTSLAGLRALARREVLDASTAYHQEAGEPIPATMSQRWLVAGHQPELFHPGVWYKNFALHRLAVLHQALPLNVVIDTDAAKPALLHVPSDAHIARIAYDRSVLDAPYEERTVVEESTFADLPNRVAPLAAGWPFEPILPWFWQDVLRHAARTPLLGERFAAGRRAAERRFGCLQREVPMSRVCETEAFAWFACALLGQLPQFHRMYNEVVHAYRATHGIRSRNHPVPDLGVAGAWLEAPFWAWRQGQTRRGKLFVRHEPGKLTLRIGNDESLTLPNDEPRAMVEAWRNLGAVKIRTRALTTTLFVRLFLADLFIHGIGGGIYDVLTDRLIERFFGLPAPAYLVLSATLLLPLPRHADAEARLRQLARRRRDLIYKPERFLTAPHRAAAQKQAWIDQSAATPAERVERFKQIRALNAQMWAAVEDEIERVASETAAWQRFGAVDEVSRRRDYAFCLYPETMLRELV